MSDLYFNDKRFVGYSKISDVFFLLPAIMWYMERERIKDADSLVICVHWLCFQCGLFIRCKRKIKKKKTFLPGERLKKRVELFYANRPAIAKIVNNSFMISSAEASISTRGLNRIFMSNMISSS